MDQNHDELSDNEDEYVNDENDENFEENDENDENLGRRKKSKAEFSQGETLLVKLFTVGKNNKINVHYFLDWENEKTCALILFFGHCNVAKGK